MSMEVGKKERKIGNVILLAGGESNIERLVGRTTTTERERERKQRGWRRSP
jgi:hypothetical protein